MRASHITHDITQRQQVFGEQWFLNHFGFDFDQLRQRHQLTIGCAHGHGQHVLQTNLRLKGQLQAHWHGHFAAVIAHVSGIDALQAALHSSRNGTDRNAQCFGTLGAHLQPLPGCIGFERRVNTHNAGGFGKGLGHIGGQGLTTRFIGAIDFGHQRAHDRWARWHFDHFDVGTVCDCYFFQSRAQALSYGMALFRALVLVDQVNLQVTLLGIGAQIVLTHQAIEGDGTGGARIRLHIQDFFLLR